MSVFFDNNITDVGRQLWAEMQAGGSFVPTKIVVGSGYLPTGKTTKTVTAVAEPVQSIQLNKSEKMSGGDYVFGGVFTNKDVTAAFYYRELALYAKVERTDGTETAETLYSYGNAGANAELIPAYSTGTAIERQLDILSYIGNDATVTVEIATGIYVSKTEFDAKISELKEATDNSVKKTEGKDLSTNDYDNASKEKVDNLPDNTTDALKNKVDKVAGKGLSTNDYTDDDKGKVDNLPENTSTALGNKADKPTVLTGTLTTGATSLVLSNAAITTGSIIDIYTDKYGISPTAVNTETGKITMTFEAQTVAVGIRVEVR